MNSHDEKPDLRARFTAFFAQYRIPLVVVVAVIFVGLLIFFVGSEVRESRVQRSLELAEQAQSQYDDWSNLEDDSDDAAAAAEELESTIEEILARYSRSYAAARALFIRGSLAFDTEDYEGSAAAFEDLADRFPESHLAPVALANAAAALEEAGNEEDAARLWTVVVDTYGNGAAESARALFSLGRLAEDDGAFTDAAVHYNRLLDDYPASSWTNLARNRIIYLTTEGLIGS